MKQTYTQEEIENEIKFLKNTFDIVRLVNPVMGSVMKKDSHNGLVASGCFCFEAWNKNQRCKNCISALAFSQRNKQTKLEYIGSSLFCIISRYVTVDSQELVLETVTSFKPEYTAKILGEETRSGEMIKFYRQTIIDDLTGLYNRRFLRENLPVFIMKAKTDGSLLGVLFISIDNLQQIISEYGLVAGDSAVTAVASSLHATIADRPDDFIARFSDDGFVAVIENTDILKLEDISKKLMRAVSRTSVADYPFVTASVTIGGTVSFEGANYEKLMSVADRHLFKAKQLGKGACYIK